MDDHSLIEPTPEQVIQSELDNVAQQHDAIPAGTDESTLLLLRTLSDRDRQKRLVRDLQQQLAVLQSQPRLQPVTPEAMAELEARHGYVTFFAHGRSVRCTYSRQRWWDDENIQVINPLEWQWFIDLSTIPEVQQ